jgi:NAD(P)-dependent dehydrogenase (short-subunit alcohol dehydrogenase family)
MKVAGKVCVVTGGASGIGRALCVRFAADGAAGVVVVDRNADGAGEVATAIGGLAVACDIGSESEVTAMVARATEHYGRVDVMCHNAGIANDNDFLTGPVDPWHQQWAVNVMGQVYATRAVLPQMLERGEGYLLHTASMAGLLTSVGQAAYAATKSAVVALAEWLSITYGRRGIEVFLLAPIGVDTPMLAGTSKVLREIGPVVTPAAVADLVTDAFAEGRFLTFTDPVAEKWLRGKAADRAGWIAGMRNLNDLLEPSTA